MYESVSLWRCHHLDPTVVDLNDSRKILAPRTSVPGSEKNTSTASLRESASTPYRSPYSVVMLYEYMVKFYWIDACARLRTAQPVNARAQS